MDAVARLAVEPFRNAERGSPWRVLRDDRYVLALGPAPRLSIVDGIRADGDVAGVVAEVRDALRADGRSCAMWQVGPLSEPTDLAEQLLELGLRPADHPPFEPHGTALALRRPPTVDVPADVRVREATTDDELRAGFRVLVRCNGIPEDAVEAWVEPMVAGHDRVRASLYVAEIDGEPVATATAVVADEGTWLTGAGTLPEHRGRGAYRALVAARWDEAARRGAPALVVQALSLSAPVLTRAGFEPVAPLRLFWDELPEGGA